MKFINLRESYNVNLLSEELQALTEQNQLLAEELQAQSEYAELLEDWLVETMSLEEAEEVFHTFENTASEQLQELRITPAAVYAASRRVTARANRGKAEVQASAGRSISPTGTITDPTKRVNAVNAMIDRTAEGCRARLGKMLQFARNNPQTLPGLVRDTAHRVFGHGGFLGRGGAVSRFVGKIGNRLFGTTRPQPPIERSLPRTDEIPSRPSSFSPNPSLENLGKVRTAGGLGALSWPVIKNAPPIPPDTRTRPGSLPQPSDPPLAGPLRVPGKPWRPHVPGR